MSLMLALENSTILYMMVGLLLVAVTITGLLTYYSSSFAHAQHGHDDDH
jgi:hypothetical protein